MTGYVNPKDPLPKAGPDQQKEVFNLMAKAAHGFSSEDVMGAAVNLLVNALRQAHARRMTAEARYDEVTARAKELLMSHYDAMGQRRNIFPFHQHIVVPLIDLRDEKF